MPLKLKLKTGEEFYLNGSHMKTERNTVLLIETKNARILRQKDFMTERDAELSTPHAFAYAWFLHLSEKKKLDDSECEAVAEVCMELFPTLLPVIKKKDWYSLYFEIRKLL